MRLGRRQGSNSPHGLPNLVSSPESRTDTFGSRVGPKIALSKNMTYVMTSPCVGTRDTACVDVCPCEAIHGAIPLEEIRAVEAIYDDHSVPEKYEADIERNAQFFLNRALGS